MQIRIELNRRFGYGFQIRITEGTTCEVYDDEPLTMLEAMQTMDEVMGREPNKVTVHPVDPQGAPSGPEVVVFQSKPDVREAAAASKKEPVVSARGVILTAWAAWKKSGSEQSRDVMRRYCEYISTHGYRGGASRAMAELEAMSLNHGAEWIKQTFARCVRDGVALMRCVMPEL